MPTLEEFYKARDNPTFDNRLDRRVLLLGADKGVNHPPRKQYRVNAQELAELGRRVELALLIVGEYICDELIC
jgi:hypothetical protein